MHIVRTLNSVGGTRPGRQYTRKKNRAARAIGFPSHAAYVQHLLGRMLASRIGLEGGA
ncbi:hypothetical protein [Pandoraea faecigallinarum]|uniref:hypothetical protein n=1 Tax=Pandoraea faecigallinarum TaxID=656179 RepID=UPI000A8F80E3|nr:hypothetical protein [Pandoraea faecigallinarum]